MKWKKSDYRQAGSINSIKDFLKQNEWRHTGLSASLISSTAEKKSAASFFYSKTNQLWSGYNGREIAAAVLINNGGVMFPALKNADKEDLKKLFCRKLKSFYSAVGMQEDVLKVEELYNKKPFDTVNYYIFTLEKKEKNQQKNNLKTKTEYKIKTAGPEDFDKLWPLEKNYIFEEVLRNSSSFYEKPWKLRFMKTLTEQTVLYAEINGKAAGKAGTNAKGWGWNQVGGVYVLPEFRGKKLGKTLIDSLSYFSEKDNKKLCLFVKQTNTAAIMLYNSIGFINRGNYRISYF